MFAFVQYKFDGKTAVVKLSAIRDFTPRNVADFEPTKLYSVYWPGDEDTIGDFYEARILHLAESMEEMDAYKEKRPRKVLVDLPRGKKRSKEKVEQSQKKIRCEARHRRELQLAEEVLQDDESDFVPRSSYAALQLQLQDVQKELDALQARSRENIPAVSEQQVSDEQRNAVPRGTCPCAEERYKELTEEVRQLRAINMELQKTLSYKLFQSESRVVYATSFDVSVRAQQDPVTPSNIRASTTRVVPAPRAHCQTGKSLSNHTVPAKPVEKATMPRELVQREPASVGNPGDADLRSATVEDRGATESLQSTPQSNTAGASSFRLEDLESRDTSATSQVEDIGDVPYEEAGVELFLEDNASEEFVIGSKRDDGKVYAGCGCWIDEKAWGYLFSTSTDSMFCRSAATVFWTPEQLKTRSVTGTLSNKARHLGYTEAKPALTPEKVSSLKALFAIYMGDVPKEVADRRMKAVRKHLSQKLGDVQRR